MKLETRKHRNNSRFLRPNLAGAILLAAAALGIWSAQRAPGSTAPSVRETDLAIAITLDALRTNSACPQDLETLQRDALTIYPVLNPELATRERRNDPELARADDEGAWGILNPTEMHAVLMNDPEYRRDFEEASRSITAGRAETAR